MKIFEFSNGVALSFTTLTTRVRTDCFPYFSYSEAKIVRIHFSQCGQHRKLKSLVLHLGFK